MFDFFRGDLLRVGFLLLCAGAVQRVSAQTSAGQPVDTPQQTQCIRETGLITSDQNSLKSRIVLLPPLQKASVAIALPDSMFLQKGDQLKLSWSGSAVSPNVGMVAHGSSPHQLTFQMRAAELLEDAPSPKVNIIRGGRTVMTSPIRITEDDLKFIRTCWVTKLTSWRIAPEAVLAVSVDAVGAPVEWLTLNDYPADARKARQEGKVTFIWKVNTDRTLSDCFVIKSSGSSSLDGAACNAMMKRGRYIRAALNAAGQPVPSWDRRSVNWRLP